MSILKFLKEHLINVKKHVIIYFIFSILIWMISFFNPYLSGKFIDALISENSDFNNIVILIILISSINVINILFQFIIARSSTKLNNLLLYNINLKIYNKLYFSKTQIINNLDVGYFIDLINSDSSNLVSFFSNNFSSFFLNIASVILSISIIMLIDIKFIYVVIILVPIYLLVYRVFKDKMYYANLKYKESNNEYFSKRVDLMNNLIFIKRNVLLEFMNNIMSDGFNSMFIQALKQVNINYIFQNLNQIIIVISYVFILFYGSISVFNKELTIGNFTILNTYFSIIISSVNYLLTLVNNYQNAKISFKRLSDILNYDNDISGEVILDNIKCIELKKVNIKINNFYLFSNLSFCFQNGKVYGVKGRNGAGKSTLLNTIIGIPSLNYEGRILYNNISIDNINLYEFRHKKLAYVEQIPTFLNISVNDYFKIDSECYDENLRDNLLNIFRLDHKNILNADGNKTMFSSLSGGERQKLALIRAFSKKSSIIILDEPSSALDSSSTNTLIELINEYRIDRTVILVSHDEILLNECDEIIDLNN